MLNRLLHVFLIAIFQVTSLSIPFANAGEGTPDLPKPGSMLSLSAAYTPAILQGMTIDPTNALKFDFIVNKGNSDFDYAQKKQEYKKLVKYFLAALTVPDENQWVNLSPYEKSRIIEKGFGTTEMGRDLLAQDYILKQLSSSLMYPEAGLGKDFWNRIYAKAHDTFGTTYIPVNTFNKVWIVPDQALVYESGNSVYILRSHLKVMLEEDYMSLDKHNGLVRNSPSVNSKAHTIASQVIRQIILPAIEKEVNEGKNFALLRQIVSGMILATWYKKALKESLLGKVYADKAKLAGVKQDPKNNDAIYKQYLMAFKKGVYNYIKEDTDQYTKRPIARRYFAGGIVNQSQLTVVTRGVQGIDWAQLPVTAERVGVTLAPDLTPTMSISRRDLLAGLFATGTSLIARKSFAAGENTFSSNTDFLSSPSVDFSGLLGAVRSQWAIIRDKFQQGQPVPTMSAQDLRTRVSAINEYLDAHPISGLRYIAVDNDGTLRFTLVHNKVDFETFGPGTVIDCRVVKMFDSTRVYVIVTEHNLTSGIQVLSYGPSGREVPESNFFDPSFGRRPASAVSSAVEGTQAGQVGISQKKSDLASIAPPTPKGGIDLNAANMAMVIKRNGKGVPLPFSQQNMSQLSRLAGFDPILGEIISVNFMPVISELRAKLEGNKSPQIARTAIQGIAQVT